jgi:hypothetical protein
MAGILVTRIGLCRGETAPEDQAGWLPSGRLMRGIACNSGRCAPERGSIQLNNTAKLTPSSYCSIEIDGDWPPVNAPGPSTVSCGAYIPQNVSS